jgi:hypothetical protein
MTMKPVLVMAGAAIVMCLSSGKVLAQDNAGQGGNGGGGRGGRGNWDPAQFQQRMMDRTKEELEVTDDNEWKALEPLVQKVMDARMAMMGGMGRGMFGRPNRGGDNAQNDQPRRGPMGTPSPEADTLRKAIEGKAPKAEVKTALAKFVEARKAKQAELEQAQENLRKVLTSRQEAIATLNGLL